MAKLTINKNAGQREMTGGYTKNDLLNKLKEGRNSIIIDIAPDEIITGKPFENIFKINQEIIKAVTENMVENGYDITQPVIIWKESNILIDGHTRKLAAIKTGLKTIPAIYVSFKNKNEALYYAHALQFNRRNLSDADLIYFIKSVDINNLPGKGKKADRVSNILNISLTKAKNLLKVMKEATRKQKLAIESGEYTINQVYKKLKSEINMPIPQKDNLIKIKANIIDDKDEEKNRINSKHSAETDALRVFIETKQNHEYVLFSIKNEKNMKHKKEFRIPSNSFNNTLLELIKVLKKYESKPKFPRTSGNA